MAIRAVKEIFECNLGFYASNFAFYATNRDRHRKIAHAIIAAAFSILRPQFRCFRAIVAVL
jgi:hypothetical protein